MKYTKDQRLAIEARGTNLLLAAAAGSGKTFTLVERILHLAREGTSIDEMLVITFTRAAAADMKAKLIERMTDEAETSEHMQAQLRRVECASVCTIDAFCSDVLKSHFEAANVDPDFRIPDDAELRQLELAALERALEQGYEQGTGDLAALHFGRGVKGVSELVLQLYHFSENRPDPETWLREAALSLPSGDGGLWFEELLHAARRELRDLHARAQYALALCEHPLGPLYYAAAVRSDLECIERALALDYDALRAALADHQFVRLGQKSKKDARAEDPVLKEHAKKLRDEVKSGIGKLGSRLAQRDDALADMRLNRPALRALHALTALFALHLDALKAEKSVLSFSDVAHKALGALDHPGVAGAMRRRFRYIFVDEYQDVSDVQQALIDRIRREDNVFMVGDVKQSIYRFRHAEPSLFIDKYRRYKDGDGGRLIALGQNFRSRAAILAFTNAVFERALAGPDSEIEYDELARLYCGAVHEGDDPPVELALLVGGREEGDDEPAAPGDYTAAEREGQWIAARIKHLMAHERYFDAKAGEWRMYRPGDFAVLVRYRGAMPDLERALTRAGLPVYADMAGGTLSALEVQILQALLTVIENRRRDNELLSVLHSPVGGLTSEELAEIRLFQPEGSYRDAMLAYLSREDALSGKLRALERNLDRWRALSRALPLSQLIDTVLRESGYYAHVGRMPLGAVRQANLDLFRTYASDFDAAQSGALTAFLRYIRQVRRAGDDMGAAHALGEGEDVIRLITVHKSKGLEFPVVFGAQLGKSIAHPPKKSELMAHRALGIGLALNDMALSSRRETLSQRAIQQRAKLEHLNEELRILYVLLTRAMDRLILVGSVAHFESAAQNWRIAAPRGMTPSSYLDVIVPLILSRPGGNALLETGRAEVALSGARLRAAVAREAGIGDDAPPKPRGSEPQQADPALVAAAKTALAWRYPYAEQVLLPLKLTVTGLTRELVGPTARAPITKRPKFLSQGGLTSTERGTLTHAALRGLDLAALRDLGGTELEREVRRQLDAMLAEGQLFDALEPGLIINFLTSDVGRRLLRSETVRREWAFNLKLPIEEALALDSTETVLVQGVIDCCFIEDERWVLLDYKTDAAGDVDALVRHYRPQLVLYEKALSAITGIAVTQKLLCLLRPGLCIEVA